MRRSRAIVSAQAEGGTMYTIGKILPAAALALAGPAFMAPAFAQAPAEPPEVQCADEDVPANDVSVCEVDPVLMEAGYALGMVRDDALLFGIVPRPVMTAYSGTWVDAEADPAGPAMEVERYEYAPDWRIPALREDVVLANGDRVVRVIKGDRAWDESPAPGMNPADVTDANAIALRQARLWLSPHGIVRAAAFAVKGLCPTNDSQNTDDVLPCPDNSVTMDGNNFTVTVDGMEFSVTTDPTPHGDNEFINYVQTISVNVNGMDIVRTFSDYADGKGTGDDDTKAAALIGIADAYEIARATSVRDEYRYGTYYPAHITETINGNTTLDVNVESGWTNRYVPFPDPELLLANQ
jgi:hypothetical protein